MKYYQSEIMNIDSKIEEKYLKEFKIFPCNAIATRTNFSKMKIECFAKSSEDDVKLICHLEQEGTNTFSLKIIRKKCDNLGDGLDVLDSCHPKKKTKLLATETEMMLLEKHPKGIKK